jgi:hypothetical protein
LNNFNNLIICDEKSTWILNNHDPISNQNQIMMKFENGLEQN